MKIGVVGPCSAGKSTLINALKEKGVDARHIAQEHSYVPDMWQIISGPDILIFLEVSYPVSQQRRALDWQLLDFEDQHKRLTHAREHAHLILNTDTLSITEVLQQVITYLDQVKA
jgi:cytidylate kinase